MVKRFIVGKCATSHEPAIVKHFIVDGTAQRTGASCGR
jgi:hypothetical protein